MPTFQITCDTPGASVYYTTDGSEPSRNSTLYSSQFTLDDHSPIRTAAFKNNLISSKEDGYFVVGDEIVKDDINSVCIYDAGSEQDWGRYIFVDKNHDLCYYIDGNDYVNSTEYNIFPGTYGYEWGGYRTTTGITSLEIGDGLSNTNSLIALNLQPDTSGWRVLWDMVSQFRSAHSDDWFVPTSNELVEVYNKISYLENLSISAYYNYWTSSEYINIYAYDGRPSGDHISHGSKNLHFTRSRLCFYM